MRTASVSSSCRRHTRAMPDESRVRLTQSPSREARSNRTGAATTVPPVARSAARSYESVVMVMSFLSGQATRIDGKPHRQRFQAPLARQRFAFEIIGIDGQGEAGVAA